MLLVIYVTYYSHFRQRAAKTKARHSEPGQRRRQPDEASAPAAAPAATPAAARAAAPAAASGEPQTTNWMQSQPPPPVGWEWPREGEVIEVEVVHSVEKQKQREEAVTWPEPGAAWR